MMKICMARRVMTILAGLMMFGMAASGMAHEHDDMKKHAEHMHPIHERDEMSHDMPMNQPTMFLVKKAVDGYEVTFHVMPAQEGMAHGGTHNLMVKVEQDGKEVSDVLINSKVFFPDGSSDSKMLMKMGSWFMNGYDMGEGRHGIMILFKTADGKKHKASVYYPKEG